MIQSEKLGQDGDEEIIKELYVSNGVSYEKVSQDGSKITALEMFFSGFPRMVGLFRFPRLSTLTIIGQSVSQIQGLENCPLLTELWVAECQLDEISGLQNCIQLQKLFLYNNQIRSINNLELLTNLQVLWLNKNLISEIEGLNTLQNLVELNLADNLIETIGHSLDQNTNLQILSLSGNRIKSFKELSQLSRLARLRDLCLMEPESSPNPVCLLYNYSTHVLYHIPTLQRLDSYDVSSRFIREAAESTVMKKMMYYNMRVRLAQRQFDESRAKLQQHRKQQKNLPEERIRTLTYTLINLECELTGLRDASRKSMCLTVERPGHHGNSTSDLLDKELQERLQNKLNILRERIKIWEQQLQELEASFQQNVTQASDRKELTTHFLVLELETVGNIRFEEGNTRHTWFSTCCDLLLSRFCVWEYKPLGITGIKINRIIRVHNRSLRLRFEDKLHSLLTNDEVFFHTHNYKRHMDCLFYMFDPETSTESSEVLHILENGFKSADSYKSLGRGRGVPFSNSVYQSESPRIQFAQRQAAESAVKNPEDPQHFRHGQLIVSKVFIGHSVPIRDGMSVDSDLYPKAHSVYLNANTKQHNSNQGKPEVVCSSELQVSCDCLQRQTLWYVFDHELVLPEYLIEFEYLTQDRTPSCSPCGPATADAPDAKIMPHDDQALDEEVLAQEPRPKLRPKILTLDDKSILTIARANVLSQITVLNLHGTGLSRLKELSCLTALRYLTVSFNELQQLSEISHLPSLEFVDASFNRVASLGGMRGVRCLKELDLRWNHLTRLGEDMTVLRKHAPSLLRLDTRHNPWPQRESVRMVVLGQLKTLTHLDGELVSEEDARAAADMMSASKINMGSLLGHSHNDVERPRCLSLLTTVQLLTHLKTSPWPHTTEPEPGWTAKITALNLDGQHLSRVTNLDKLVNLRWASFNNNDLTRIEGLESCPLLEELSLDNNSINSLDGLCKLQRLTRLSINNNQIQCLSGSVLEHLPHLHFLSVESNRISSLHGVQRSRSLFELYVGNNNISTSRDIYHLKPLTSLIILDLCGNPLVEKLENYRAYVVFHLPSLKALDCIAVEVSEAENAKDVFGGRLNPDMVVEKLGYSNYTDVVDLELMSCSIRMVDLCPVDLFVNLLSVNLEGNSLTSFSGLIYLPNIKSLFLNYNHIETILPRQKVQTHLSRRQILYQKVHSSGYGQQNINKITRESVSVEGLEPLMPRLEVLHLGHNGISNLTELQISRLTNLKVLYLQGNEISQVDGLEGLVYLQELVLDHNRIRAVSENSFCGQAALLELHLAENRIKDLSHLHPLCQLQRLYLDSNKVQDLAELDKLDILQSLVELSVVGNPVARRSLHRPAVVLHLPRLQVLDGLTVTFEERTRAELLCTPEGQYSSSPGAGADITLPGLLPLSRAYSIRGANVSSGLQHLQGHETVITTNLEDTYQSNKYKKQRVGGTHTRSAQTDGSYRHRVASAFPVTGLQANKVYIGYPTTDPENRYLDHSGPKPPPT